MTEVQAILDNGHMMETEEGTFHSDAYPDVAIIQEGHTEDKTII